MTTPPTAIEAQRVRRDFDALWDQLQPVGRDAATGGYRRFAWTRVDLGLREWFAAEATRRGLEVEVDRNGNQWAWWGEPRPGSVVTGSHLDSVPGGGAFDGPLGIVSAFLAVDLLRRRGLRPTRSLAIVNFVEEEGARFGLACLGSRLMTGAVAVEHALALRDPDGVTYAEALGPAAAAVGADPQAVERIGVFIELHIEQGRGLVDGGATVGVASAISPHGRWRFCFHGEANHAGTTAIADRRDPMLPFADVVGAARFLAAEHGIVTTVGRVRVDPNGTNAIPSRVDAWLDARGEQAEAVALAVRALEQRGRRAADEHGVLLEVARESWTDRVDFDERLRARVLLALGAEDREVPVLPTAAGHDAGILAGRAPTAMLFVRNPTGVSHSPEEYAEEGDCVDGAHALAAVLADQLTGAAFGDAGGAGPGGGGDLE